MQQYKVSPSLLDAYKAVRGESKWEKTPDELIKMLEGEFIPSEAMKFGTTVHNYLEIGKSTELLTEEMTQLDPLRIELIKGSKEVKIRTKLTEDIVLSTIIDNLLGNIANEYKTGKRFWGVDTYYSSVQWKCYLLAYGADMLKYHHFQYSGKRPYKFTYRTFAFFPYEGMKEDIIQLSYDFIEWTKLNRVDHLIKFD